MILKYFFNVILIAGFFNVLIVAYLVYRRNYKNVINRAWFYNSICASLWSVFYFLTINAETKAEALVFINLVNLFGVLVVLTWFSFVLRFLNIHSKYKIVRRLLWFVGLLVYLSSFSKMFIADMVPKYVFNYYVVPGYGYLFFTIYFVFIACFGLVLLYVNYKKFKGIRAYQIKYLFLASAMGFLGGGSVFTLSYDISFPPYLLVLFTTFPLMMAYAIIKYRLMDIRVIISKIYTYIVIAIFSYFFFHFVYFIDWRFLGGPYSIISLSVGLVFAILFASSILPLISKIQKSSDVLFFKGLNPRGIIKDLTIELRGAIELKEIFRILQKNFKRVLETEELRILIFEDENKKNKACVSKKYSFNLLELDRNDKLCIQIHKDKSLIIRDEIKEKNLQKELDKINAKIIAPLITQDKVFGAIILGEKISRSAYTQEDIEFLEIITTQAAVAIENALLYEEVSELNKNLEKKVADQTRDIKEKAEHLQKLLKMRSEFLDIASHQLRTPVTVIKGALSMILDGSIKDEAKKHEFIEASFKKSIKLTDVINDILRASEMDTEKFELDLRPTDIQAVIQHVIEDKQMEAKDQKIELKLELPKKKLPTVMSDERYIEQVITNLINNSLQYTKQGYIKVSATADKSHVILKVSDTGIGIPKKDQKKLFTKFGRAQNAVETFTDGSGLGLFIIKQVMDAHPGGEVYIENTEVGKGTTFVIKIPIVK